MEFALLLLLIIPAQSAIHDIFFKPLNVISTTINAFSTVPGVVAGKNKDSKSICYENIDCMSQSAPWVSFTRPVPDPQPPESVCTQAILSTPERQNVSLRIYPEIDDQIDSLYDPSRPTYIITHGFIDTGKSDFLWHVVDAILKRGPANVFVLDWGLGSEKLPLPDYTQAVSNARTAAAVGVNLVKRLRQLGGDLGNFHLMGHSLGAHVMSYICKKFPGEIGRLTGWDPAGPGFHMEPDMIRFTKNDAIFTDAIHTNAGFLGILEPVAHADFYINSAVYQPTCFIPPLPINFRSVGDYLYAIGEYLIACPHQGSYIYYTSAIENPTLCLGRKFKIGNSARGLANAVTEGFFTNLLHKGVEKCENGDCIPMGLDTALYNFKGILFMDTKGSAPYCVG